MITPHTYGKILIVSAALNFFLIGFLLHPFLMHPPGFPPMPGMPPFMHEMSEDGSGGPAMMLRHVSEGLSPQGKIVISKIIDEQQNNLKESHEKLHMAFGKLHDLIDQDQVDDATLKNAIDAIGLAQADIHQAMSTLFLRVHSELSPGDRKILKQRLDPRM